MIFYHFFQRNFCFLTETATLQLVIFLAWKVHMYIALCHFTFSAVPDWGGGVLPYIGCIGMYGPKG